MQVDDINILRRTLNHYVQVDDINKHFEEDIESLQVVGVLEKKVC